MDFQNYGNFDEFINSRLSHLGEGNIPGGFNVSGFPRQPGRSRPLDLDAEASLEIPFAEAFHGCERTLSVRTFVNSQESVQVRIPAGSFPPPACASRAIGLQPASGTVRQLPQPLALLRHSSIRVCTAGLHSFQLGGMVDAGQRFCCGLQLATAAAPVVLPLRKIPLVLALQAAL